MRYEFICAEKAIHSVKLMCEVLAVSRSGYYAWKARPASRRAQEDEQLLLEVRKVYVKHRGRYGSPRVCREIRKGPLQPGRHRIARLMRENGIVARPKKRYRVTTQSGHGLSTAKNLLDRKFAIAELNTVWAADITYLDTLEGWLYLAVVIDLASRRVVGWSTRDSLETELPLEALRTALETRGPPALHHSDRGAQYAASSYQTLLDDHGIEQSMSRPGNCWDNAPVESFFSTLKLEVPELQRSSTKQSARQLVFDYIEAYYNPQRMHSTLGYMTPQEYELAA